MTTRPKGTRNLLVLPDSRRVRRYKVDAVGNNLNATLRWCSVHWEPVWVYDDGSYTCPHDRIVEVYDDNHKIDDGPWELAATEGGRE